MHKALLGTIAAATAGAGWATAQAPRPTPPAPVAIAPAMSNLMPAGGPEMMPGGMPGMMPGMPGMGMDPGMGGMGGPLPYPPPGDYGQPRYETGGNPYANHHAPHLWVNAENILWFNRGLNTGPLLVTTAPGDNGLLGRPTSSTLFPDNGKVGFDLFTGFKINAGWYRDADKRIGLELGGFMAAQKTKEFATASDGTGLPLISRPFTDANTLTQSRLLVSFPTFASGVASVVAKSGAFGAEANIVANLYRSCPDNDCLVNVNAIYGFRYLQLEEQLEYTSSTTLLNGNSAPFNGVNFLAPARISVMDSISTSNRFYGGQFGGNVEVKYGRMFLDLSGKLALGYIHQRADIDGNSSINDPNSNTASTVRGGLYANATNIGRYNQDRFGIIPEVGAKLGYNWCSWFSTSVGYNALYINRVLRPADQYSTTVNPSTVPTSPQFGLGAAVPAVNPAGTQTEYWLQGVTFGVHIRY